MDYAAVPNSSDSLSLTFFRAGLPSARAPTVAAVPSVQSCTPAAAMDDIIRNRKGGGGLTRLDGDSARESA